MTYIINCGLANIAWNKLTAKVTAISKLLHSLFYILPPAVVEVSRHCLFSFTAFMITAIKKEKGKEKLALI